MLFVYSTVALCIVFTTPFECNEMCAKIFFTTLEMNVQSRKRISVVCLSIHSNRFNPSNLERTNGCGLKSGGLLYANVILVHLCSLCCYRHNSRSPRRSMGKISHFGNQINSTYLYIIVKVIHYYI